MCVFVVFAVHVKGSCSCRLVLLGSAKRHVISFEICLKVNRMDLSCSGLLKDWCYFIELLPQACLAQVIGVISFEI